MRILRIFLYLSFLSGLKANSKEAMDQIVMKEFKSWRSQYGFLPQSSTNNINNGNNINSDQVMCFKKSLMETKLQDLKYFTGRAKFYMKLNALSAFSPESKSILNGFVMPVQGRNLVINNNIPYAFPPAPPSLDYRQQGLVTAVLDQGFFCSSCYTFSATCALEGQIAKKYKRLVQLSKQNLVDCSMPYGNLGCEGGYMSAAYQYINKNGGIANETTYSYSGLPDTCQYEPYMKSAQVLNHTFVMGDEENLKRALAAVGPLAAAVKGDLDSFYGYGGGIYEDANCTSQVNHAVCLVGYGTDNSTKPPTDYWIVKNSWSTEWGETGYFRLRRGKNMCGITAYVVYPTV